MSARAKALANLYRRRKVSRAGLMRAAADGVITAAQYQEITGAAYQAAEGEPGRPDGADGRNTRIKE